MKIYVNYDKNHAIEYSRIEYIYLNTDKKLVLTVSTKNKEEIEEYFDNKKEAQVRFDFLVKEWNESLNN